MSTTDDRHRRFSLVLDAALKRAKAQGLSANQVAEALGVNPSTVSSWRNPDRKGLPSRENLAKLADLLGVDLGELRSKPASPAPVFGLAALAEALWKAEQRAERYHALLVETGRVEVPQREELQRIRDRVLRELAQSRPDPDTTAAFLDAWSVAVGE